MEDSTDENEICIKHPVEQEKFEIQSKINENQSSSLSSQTKFKAYVSRALSSWGNRIWAFSFGVFINKLAPDNLRTVAIYGFVLSVSLIVCGASIGRWIDQNKRWFAAKVFIFIENVSVILASVVLLLYYMFWMDMDMPRRVVITSVMIISIIGNLAAVGCKIIIQKDWIVVLTAGYDTQLAAMNAVFTTIDLAAMVISPILAGFLFNLASPAVVCLVVAVWNTVSTLIEYFLLQSIYNDHPELAMKKEHVSVVFDATKKGSSGGICSLKGLCAYIKSILMGWKLYMNHNIRNAGLGLAFLYMTVLGFDNITYGFCLSQCVTESLLGILVGISALIGVLGSLSFPYIRNKLGLARTGLIGMGGLIISDLLCVSSIWLNGSPFDPQSFWREIQATENIGDQDLYPNPVTPSFVETNNSTISLSDELLDCQITSFISVSILLSGILVAKFGLWISDLTITQTIQENVEEEHRGVINGVQDSMNSLMDTMKFALVISLPEEKTFGFLIMASFVSIVSGAALYTTHALNSMKKEKSKEILELECLHNKVSPHCQ